MMTCPVSKKSVSAQIPIKHSFFRWWYTKAWEQSLYDSELIATKTWKAMVDNLVETCIDWMSFNFKIKIF